MPKKLLMLLSLSLIAVMVLVACGDDEDDPTATTASPGGAATTAPSTPGGGEGNGDAIRVEMLDTMRYSPDTITVAAGSEVTIELVNVGMIPHTFTIDEADVDVELAAQEEETFTFTAPSEPGEYEIYCAIPGHRQAGMVATLVVE